MSDLLWTTIILLTGQQIMLNLLGWTVSWGDMPEGYDLASPP